MYNFNVFLCEIWKTEGSNSNQKTLNSGPPRNAEYTAYKSNKSPPEARHMKTIFVSVYVCYDDDGVPVYDTFGVCIV